MYIFGIIGTDSRGTGLEMINVLRWRERAAEMLAQAEVMTSPTSRRALLDIAAGYERLACRRAERLRDDPLAAQRIEDSLALPLGRRAPRG
jgi:hypothetical protein